MNSRMYRRLFPFVIAIDTTAIALLLMLWLEPLMIRTSSALFFIAITLSTWYGGIYPGIVSAVLSTLAIDYFLTPPIYQISLFTTNNLLRLAIFLFMALLIDLLSTNLKNSKRKVQQLNRILQEENADRLRTALNAAQMGMWDWDFVTGKITWSEEHERLFGLAPGSFDGRYETFDACLHPEDREGFNQAIAYSLKNHIPYHHEFRVVWQKNGSIHWIEGRGKAFYNHKKQPVRMSGTIMLIDSRKQTEILLKQQFEQQQLVLEMTQRIRRSLNLHDILQTTVDEVREYLKTDRVIIFKFTPAWGGTIVVESVVNGWMPLLPLEIYDPCIGEQYVKPFIQGLVTAKSDIYNSGITRCHIEFLAQLQVRANLVVPVMKDDKLWGLLAAHHCAAPRQWQKSEIILLQQLAAQVSVALQQSELFEKVQTELTERKQAQLALEQLNTELEARVTERTAELADLYNHAPCGYHSLDSDGFIILINDTELNWLGYNREEILGKMKMTDLLTPGSKEIFYQSFLQLKQQGWVSNLEFQILNKNGMTRWVSLNATAIRDLAGNFIMSRSTMFDITDRKRIEKALRQSEETFRLLSEFSPIGIFLSNVAGKIIYTNPLYQQIIGASAEESLGDGWKDFIHPDDRQWVFQYWSELIATANEGVFNELRYQDRQGKICYTQVRIAPIKSSDGTVILFVGTVEDITERRKIDQMKKDFISVVSHELRTPLTSIRGSLGLIAGGVYDKKPEKMKEMISIAARQSDRLMRLINDILDLRRLESGQTTFNFQKCAAAELIQQSVDVTRSQAEQNQIAFLIIPSEVEVWADGNAIVQTLTNLLSNAIKFSPPNSTITISAKIIPEYLAIQKQLPLSVLFSVQDQGRGIPEDKLETIFGQFQQVDASDSREKGGTGLGLAICRNIIEQHGGKIWAESVFQEGSNFYFTIPLFNDDAKTSFDY